MKSRIFLNTTSSRLGAITIRPILLLAFLIFVLFVLNKQHQINLIAVIILLVGLLTIILEMNGLYILIKCAADKTEIIEEKIIFTNIHKNRFEYQIQEIILIDVKEIKYLWTHFPIIIKMNDGKSFRLGIWEYVDFINLIKKQFPEIKLTERAKNY